MSIAIDIQLDEKEIRTIIANSLNQRFGFTGYHFKSEDLPIQVKSKQNFKSEWEEAAIRISVKVMA